MSTAHQADEATIRQLISGIADGLGAKDLDALRRIYAPDVVSFDVEPPLQHVGVEAKLKNWERAFAMLDDLHYEVRDLAVEVGDVVAFAHCFGRLSGTLADGTATEGMWVRGTFCFRKVGDDWLIAHDQASVPLDFPTGRACTDLEP
ncbi:hypothetical protein Athai_67000 [Actinocatenispora thailandica]|uniref:SnoaL-like domain-containing protein n=1 Tax=Actinocatenispora thailandica TaxID=227318 RepID=A0A7R7DXH6_9ACTN|nr:nuclear transport factor 2 family protein [Actinocatenispora thailandica]BCJ39197.1 hypothetical protein Athai_67000 [Actinocatenispora thailandica]